MGNGCSNAENVTVPKVVDTEQKEQKDAETQEADIQHSPQTVDDAVKPEEDTDPMKGDKEEEVKQSETVTDSVDKEQAEEADAAQEQEQEEQREQERGADPKEGDEPDEASKEDIVETERILEKMNELCTEAIERHRKVAEEPVVVTEDQGTSNETPPAEEAEEAEPGNEAESKVEDVVAVNVEEEEGSDDDGDEVEVGAPKTEQELREEVVAELEPKGDDTKWEVVDQVEVVEVEDEIEAEEKVETENSEPVIEEPEEIST